LPEPGVDPKDTTTIAGTFPMDSRDRLLYSKIASIGGEEIAAKFMDDYQQRGGVAPDWAVRFYNTELTRKEPPPEQLVSKLRDLAGKTNALKNASPDDVKNFRPTPEETRILTALSRITAAQGNVENLSVFEQQVLAAAQGLMKKPEIKPSDAITPAAPAASAPAAPAAAAPAPEVKAAPPVAAAPAVKAAAPTPAVPAAAPAAAPAADGLPPKPALKAYPAPPTGVVSTQQKAAYDNSVKAVDEENKAIMKDYELRYGTAAANAARSKDLEQKKKELEQAAEVAAEVEARKDFTQRGKDAIETLATANVMRRFTEDKSFNKMTGILNNNKISSGIAALVESGIGSKNFTIGVPAIQDVMRNADLSPAEQATYRTFLMYTAQMQLNAERAMKGSTTERERLILGNANISPQDTAETVRRKADLLTAKGQFDRQAARAFKAVKSKMTAEEFLDSDQYMSMYDKYYQNIADIASGSKTFKKPEAAAKSTGAVEPSPGFIKDSKTGVYRKKKEGE